MGAELGEAGFFPSEAQVLGLVAYVEGFPLLWKAELKVTLFGGQRGPAVTTTEKEAWGAECSTRAGHSQACGLVGSHLCGWACEGCGGS